MAALNPRQSLGTYRRDEASGVWTLFMQNDAAHQAFEAVLRDAVHAQALHRTAATFLHDLNSPLQALSWTVNRNRTAAH
jgi:hypothetical protein